MHSIPHLDGGPDGGPATPATTVGIGGGAVKGYREAARLRLAAARRSEDAEVVARLRNGELPALDTLWDRYARAVFVRCWRVLRERQPAWDVTHDTFIAFLAHLPCRCGQPAREWLFATCTQLAAEHPSKRRDA